MNYRGGTRRGAGTKFADDVNTSEADVQKEISTISKITGVE